MGERFPSSRDIETLTANPQGSLPAIAILPVGCTEQHGPHLPLETDTIIARGMAESLAPLLRGRRFPVHLLPAIAYSPTRSNASYSGTVSVGEQVFRDYLSSVIHSLLASEFGTIILLSGHGPADPSLREVAFVMVDAQFRTGRTICKPIIPVSLADSSAELGAHFPDPPGRHADWGEFLLLYHLLGQSYFTQERMRCLEAFQQEHDFDYLTGTVPGVPLEYRSTHGVIGRPLPQSGTDYGVMGERAWSLIRDRVFKELLVAMDHFPRGSRGGEQHGV